MSSGLIPVFLYRADWGDGDVYYGTMRQIQARDDVEILGVATRPAGETIPGAPTRESFQQNVAQVSEGARWFDSELTADDETHK